MRTTLVAGLAALVLGAAWFLTRDGAELQAQPRPADAPAAPAAAEAPPPLAEPEGERAPVERQVAEVQQAAAAPQEEPIVQSAPADQATAGAGEIAVQVVDDSGEPVGGLRVELMLEVPGSDSSDVAKAMTELPDGVARLDVGRLASQRSAMERMGISGTFSVRAVVASSVPVEAELGGWPEGGETVKLELPPMGGLSVHVVDGQGEPVEGKKSVAWGWLPLEVARNSPDEHYEFMRDHGGAGEGTEPVPIARVGLGLALSLNARVPGRVGGQLTAVEGPTQPGEVVAVTLPVGQSFAQVRFRCVDAQGQPIAGERIQAHVVERTTYSGGPMERERRGSQRLSTNSDGVASQALAPGRAKAERWLEVSAGRAYPRNAGELDLCGGWAPLPIEMQAGESLVLPDIVLLPAKPIVEGQVTDPDGKPLKGALVYVNHVFPPGSQVAWNGWDWFLRTDDDGRFRIVDTVVPGALALRVSHSEHRDHFTGQDLAAGENLQIVLEPAERKPRGTLVVQVEMPKDVSFTRCLLKFRREGGRTHSPDWAAGHPMKLDYLEPGTYDVYVVTRDGRFELGRVEDVIVRKDEVTEDARLLPFDLTDRALAVAFQFRRTDGTPRRREEFEVGFPESQESVRVRTNDKGEAKALLLTSHINGIVHDSDGAHANFTVGPGSDPIVITF